MLFMSFERNDAFEKKYYLITQLTQPIGEKAFLTADERRSTQINGERTSKRQASTTVSANGPKNRQRYTMATPTAVSSDQVSIIWNLNEFSHLRSSAVYAPRRIVQGFPKEPLNKSTWSAFRSEKPQIVRAVTSDSSRRYGRVASRARCGFSGETLMGRAFAGPPPRL
jgi:hypothetical protein